MMASFFKILFAASLTQNPFLATRFFFMAGAMATWQQHRLATDERWGPPSFKEFKVPPPATVQGLNFEHFELGVGFPQFQRVQSSTPGHYAGAKL
jgi:hypothetical protein